MPLALDLLCIALLEILAVRRGSGAPRDLGVGRTALAGPAALVAAGAVYALAALPLPFLADDFLLLRYYGGRSWPWEVLEPAIGERWYRPAGWLLWWVWEQLSPGAASGETLAPRAVAGALWIACVLVAPRALRRLGIPRGTARVAALLFALHPAAFETVAWLANGYSLLSLLGVLSAVAWLPRRPTPRAFLPSALAATLAFLSKEDSWILPVLVALVALRRRHGRPAFALGAALAVGLPLAATIALRLAMLGGIGGYSAGPRAESVHLLVSLGALGDLVASKLPAFLFLPARASSVGDLPRDLLGIPPILLAVLALAGRPAGAPLRRALLLALLLLGPVLAVLLPDRELLDARHFFGASLALSAVVASLVAAAPLGARGRGLLLAGWALLSAVVAFSNRTAWTDSARALESGLALASRALADAPPGARVLIQGLPGGVRGVPCFGDGKPAAIERTIGGGLVLENTTTGFGALDRLLLLEPGGPSMRAPLSEPPARTLAARERLRLDLTAASPDRALCIPQVLTADDAPDGSWRLRGNTEASVLLLPVVDVPAGATVALRVEGSGRWASGEDQALPFVASYPTASCFERVGLTEPGLVLPADARRLRFECVVVPGLIATLRSIELEVVAP